MCPVVNWTEFKKQSQIIISSVSQASSPHSQHPTVDVSQLHDPHGYSQHSIQVQHIQVAEPSGTGQGATQVSSHNTNSGVRLMSNL